MAKILENTLIIESMKFQYLFQGVFKMLQAIIFNYMSAKFWGCLTFNSTLMDGFHILPMTVHLPSSITITP